MERGCWEGRGTGIQAILKLALRPLVSFVQVVRQSYPCQGLRESSDRMRKDQAPVQGPPCVGSPGALTFLPFTKKSSCVGSMAPEVPSSSWAAPDTRENKLPETRGGACPPRKFWKSWCCPVPNRKTFRTPMERAKQVTHGNLAASFQFCFTAALQAKEVPVAGAKTCSLEMASCLFESSLLV